MWITTEQLPTLHLLAAGYNLCIIPFSKFFGPDLGSVDSSFDPFGALTIVLWGLAYGSIHKSHPHTPVLSLVFGIEKLCFGLRWIWWFSANYDSKLLDLIRSDPLTGLFFSGYGIFDLLTAALFFFCAVRYWDGPGVKDKDN